MADRKISGGKAPRWLFVFIPLGFVLIVAVMLLVGRQTGGPTQSPFESGDILDTGESPPADAAPGDAPGDALAPSGPEYRDNETIIE